MPDGTTIEARREPYPSGAVNREYYQVRDLETGAKIAVPLFIESGDVIKVDTQVNEYIQRV